MAVSIRGALVGAALFMACLAAAANDDLPQALAPEQEALAIAAAETIGRAIFEHDRAAAVATDVALAQRAFTRSCIALNRGPKVGAMMITHLLDPVPTEAHVFWSLWAGTPMYLTTPPAGLWSIERGVIREVEKDDE